VSACGWSKKLEEEPPGSRGDPMHRFQTICAAMTVLTGVAFASARPAPTTPVVPRTAAVVTPAPVRGGDDCLAEGLCRLQHQVGRQRGLWTPETCRSVAAGMTASAARHGLSPALLLAVMIQESNLDEHAVRESHPHGKLARDSGLMGIRCHLDGRGRCTNGLVRGLPWRQLMSPLTNIEFGAQYLALYRDGAGRSRVVSRTRQPDGTVREVARSVPCRHLDHAYWAHYNHGTHYIAHGPARWYPVDVAALYAAVGETLGLDTSELARVKTKGNGAVADAGDRAAHQRSAQLCGAVHAARLFCSTSAIASL
jgi:hypothetical protein